MENPQDEVTIIPAHTLTEDLEWRAGLQNNSRTKLDLHIIKLYVKNC